MEANAFDLYPKSDIHPVTGKPKSEYPSWYFTEQLNELKDTIAMSRQNIANGTIPERMLPQARADLSFNETKLSTLLDSIPKVNDFNLDKFAKIWRELGVKISDSMYTYSDMQRGTADAHEEARRMMDPIIDVRDDALVCCKSCGCNVHEGRVSRNDAIRVWKIIAKFLGENTNSETLRKETRKVK
jgi:hypothetical protein